MTAKQYVKEVGKLLKCRASKKKEVKRQLLLEIDRAVSGGEALEDVLKRMGIPWDYANQYNDSFDKAEWKAAKREKRLKIWGIVLIVIAAILAALYWNLPKWSDISESTIFDEEQLKLQAEEIIRLYGDNDFQAVNMRVNEDMRQILSEETLQLTKSQIEETFGELLSFETIYVSEVEQRGKMYAMIQIRVSYSDRDVTYTITFDDEMKIAGFHVK
ncbi:MAG: DUF3887 domain-containing protein [Lachnospiraceae bacterium]|nr:DUF3887 domain-containing protein [Lachnospiraceae bacterium]